MDIKAKNKLEFLLSKKDLRLDKFINCALFDKNGYYSIEKPIGKKNDFVTAPEVSQMFGEIIGLYLFYIWKSYINSKFNFIELGPGRGTLFKDIANSVSNNPIFLSNARVMFIEINKRLIKLQKENVKNFNHKVEWKQKINFNSKIPSIIYSNEFFDCFPVRQFVFKNNWYEKYVSLNTNYNNLYLKDKLVSNKKLLSLLNNYKANKLLEISFERNKYFENICKYIKNKGGIFLTIDYGYLKGSKNFTLQAVQNHKYSNIFENIGKKDISSHVNFAEFINIAKKNNLKVNEICTQREFLIKYGILEREKKLSLIDNSINTKNDLNRLISNNEMGDLFKCLIVSNL